MSYIGGFDQKPKISSLYMAQTQKSPIVKSSFTSNELYTQLALSSGIIKGWKVGFWGSRQKMVVCEWGGTHKLDAY